MARANNSPTNWSEGLTTADKSDMLTVFDSFRRLPPVRKNDTAEINERLDNYFKVCADNAIIPTVEPAFATSFDRVCTMLCPWSGWS